MHAWGEGVRMKRPTSIITAYNYFLQFYYVVKHVYWLV